MSEPEQVEAAPVVDDRPLIDKSTNVTVGPGGISITLAVALICLTAMFFLIGSGRVSRANFDAFSNHAQPVVVEHQNVNNLNNLPR